MPEADLLHEVDPTPTGASDNALGARYRSHRWGRRVVRGVAVLVALVAGYYLVSLFQVWRAGREQTPEPASVDAIVVLGAAQYDGRPSDQLAARLDHGLLLWELGVAPRIMVTGGKRPGDRFTEAEAAHEYLVDRGVPESAILREDVGATTYDSLRAAADVLGEAGIEDVVLVTDPFHSLRSKLIAEEVGLSASLSPTQTSVVTGWTSFRREMKEAGGVAIGRLIGFGRLTDITG